jgi:hypothetical protein
VAEVEASTGVAVRSIVTVLDVLEYLPGRTIDGRVALTEADQRAIEDYLAEYGIGK